MQHLYDLLDKTETEYPGAVFRPIVALSHYLYKEIHRNKQSQYVGYTGKPLSGIVGLLNARRAGYSSEFSAGVCRPVLQILTLFHTKI